jgi:hypothetical protein
MSKQRLTMVILALVGIISCFLPWASQIISILGFEVLTGQICLGFFSVTLIISLIGDIKKDLRDWQLLVPYTSGLLSLVISVLHILGLNIISSQNSFINESALSGYELGFAPYIAASVSLLICILIFVLKDAKKELENVKIIRKVVKEVEPKKRKLRKKTTAVEHENSTDRKKKLLSERKESPTTPSPTQDVIKPKEKPITKKEATSSDHDRFMPK